MLLDSIKNFFTWSKNSLYSTTFSRYKFIAGFKENSETFNSSFAKQRSLIDNWSTLLSLFPLIKGKTLSDVDFLIVDVQNIISNLDSNKVHGDNMISIRWLKLRDKSICKPLNIIFKSCLTQGLFPSEWKEIKSRTNSQKKKKSKPFKNCRPVSLLPICSKVFEHIIYNTMFPYFIENNGIFKNLSGFCCPKSEVRSLVILVSINY